MAGNRSPSSTLTSSPTELGRAPSASAFVQEADCAERVIVLKVRVPGQTSFVIVGAAGGTATAGLVPQGTRQAAWGARLPPGSVRQRGREDALAGARILALGEREALIDHHGQARIVRAENGRVIVTDAVPEALASEGSSLVPFVDASNDTRANWEERGAALVLALASEAAVIRRGEARRALDKARVRITRRCSAIRDDLARVKDADRIAEQAQWLVAEAHRTPRGARKLVVTDWSTGEPVPFEVPLDPAKSARDQVEAMFKRAKRLRLGARIAEDRLARATAELDGIARALERIDQATEIIAIDDALREAKRIAPRDVSLPSEAGARGGEAGARGASKSDKEAGRRTPFRHFVSRSGRKIFVGKGATDNDTLTHKVARPHDVWLHAKDRAGAHVIVPQDKGKTILGEELVDAAHLAAHFSDARGESLVDVQYTQRRHLRKPKGSPAGFVVVDREKVLVLRVDPEIVRALLEREET